MERSSFRLLAAALRSLASIDRPNEERMRSGSPGLLACKDLRRLIYFFFLWSFGCSKGEKESMEEGRRGESFGEEINFNQKHLWGINYWTSPFIDGHQSLGQEEGRQRLQATPNCGIPKFLEIGDGMRKKIWSFSLQQTLQKNKKKISWHHPSF